MKVKTFGSLVTEIEKNLQNWLNENKGVEVKHLAMGLNAASDWGLVLIVYEEKKDMPLFCGGARMNSSRHVNQRGEGRVGRASQK